MARLLSQPAEVALSKIASLDSGAPYPDLAVLRVPSIVEGYVDSLLDSLSAEYVRGDSDFHHALESLTHDKLHQNWNSRREWLGAVFHLDIGKSTESQDFFLLVDLRNAVAHGGGGLTRSQQRALKDQLALEHALTVRLRAFVNARRIVLTNDTATAAIRVGNRYIRALDAVAAPALAERSLL